MQEFLVSDNPTWVDFVFYEYLDLTDYIAPGLSD